MPGRPLTASQRARLSHMTLRQAVQALAACLGDLAPNLRTVLELRAGIGPVRHPLSRTAVARYLHVTQRRVTGLEKRALSVLIATAGTRGCGRSSSVLGGAFMLQIASFEPLLGASEGASEEVAGARYTKTPSRERSEKKRSQTSEALQGISLPRDAGQALEIVLIAIGTLTLVSLVFGDRLGLGDRWRRWRSRHTRGPSR